MAMKTVLVTAIGIFILTGLAACSGSIVSKPGVFEARTELQAFGDHSLHVTYVKPVAPRLPLYLVLVASGDAGWMGASSTVLNHLAEEGYTLAAYDSSEFVKQVERSGHITEITEAADHVESIIAQSRRALGLPDSTPVIAIGFSRGANLVVFTAGVRSLRRELAGAVAIALTREMDYLKAPAAEQLPPSLQVDDKGRMQTYSAIPLAGSIRFAVIQSTGDSYVPAKEARRLFGPDNEFRRLYEVDALNHGFWFGTKELLRDLDDSLRWIEGSTPAG
jgi:hypothetical protein